MRVHKDKIRLSPKHPSRLLSLKPESVFFAPVVIDQHGNLIDGYRRLRLEAREEVEAIFVDVTGVFEAALAMNLHSRKWDDTDCFLWMRWANSMGISKPSLPINRFAEELDGADEDLLRLLAERRLSLRQAVLILQSPLPYRPFFTRLLSAFPFNNNETADLIELCCDLKKRTGISKMEDLIREQPFETIVQDGNLNGKQKAERLLKAMRILRYPEYQKKSEDFSSYWRQLNFGANIQVKKDRFLLDGKLDIRLSAASRREMKESVDKLYESLDSPWWERIWE